MKPPSLPLSSRTLRLSARLGLPGTLFALALVLCLASAGLAYGALWLAAPGLAPVGAALAAATAFVVTPVAGALVAVFFGRLEKTAAALAEMAQPVGPGAVQNRRQFLVAAQREWARRKRHGEDAALLLLDVDHLGSVQKDQGAAVAESLMRDVIRAAAHTLRQSDLLSRFGDDGLAVYLPRTDPLGALDVAERLRAAVESIQLRVRTSVVRTTASVGVASAGPGTQALDEMVRDAGVALQKAREAGRNCVRAAPIPSRQNGEPSSNPAPR